MVSALATLRTATRAPRLPDALNVPFRSFKNKYQGATCHIVGRGPTDFDYAELADLTEPVFFINDAICLETYVQSDTFFFAHDSQLRLWLDGSVRGAAVLPVEGTILADDPGAILNHAGPLVRYHRDKESNRDLLLMTRDQIAQRNELFVHSATIHSALHFAWFCGFKRVIFIGCDGRPHRQYDSRLQNRSQGFPGRGYGSIRKVQDSMAKIFALQTLYVGTPDW